MRQVGRSGIAAACAATICSTADLAQAQDTEPAETFFKGKSVTLLIGGTAGGGLDTAARIFSRFAGRHIPGNPTVTPQLMPGAGGIRVIDFLASSAPKDGTTIAVVPSGPLVEPLVGGRKVTYKMQDFQALGAWAKDFSLCVAWHASGFKSLADAQSREMTVAGTGAAATPDTFPIVLNATLGTKFKVITGYLGTQETILAVERGETHGRCGWSWSSLKATKLDWVKDKKVHLFLQMGAEKSPLFPDVPYAPGLAKTPEDKQLMAPDVRAPRAFKCFPGAARHGAATGGRVAQGVRCDARRSGTHCRGPKADAGSAVADERGADAEADRRDVRDTRADRGAPAGHP